jgi:UDP-glucose 4-epimerase
VQEVVDAVTKVSGREVPLRRGDRRPGDPPRLVAANGRAGELLGWAARRSEIGTIIADAWRWHEREGER